jgi:acetyl esterase/lipase
MPVSHPIVPALILALSVATLATTPAAAQEVIPLWPNGAPTDNGLSGPPEGERCIGNVTEPTLTVFHPEPSKATGAAVLVIPGGGYAVVCVQVEGWPTAEVLTEAGFTVAVLTYRLPNGHLEVPFQDAQQAMRMIRSRAAEWNVSPDRVGVMGFSATTGLRARFSNQLRITPETPPTFLVHAADDETVHLFNSIQFFQELKQHGVRSELHVFDHGGHGFGVSPTSPANQWDELATDWLFRLLDVSR